MEDLKYHDSFVLQFMYFPYIQYTHIQGLDIETMIYSIFSIAIFDSEKNLRPGLAFPWLKPKFPHFA